MHQTDKSDLPTWRRIISGLILAIVGTTMLATSWSYSAGSLTQMGPGFMPQVIAIAIIAMGLGIIVSDLRDPVSRFDERSQPLHWRSLVFICCAVLVFVLLIEPAGLVPAMFCAVAVSMLANPNISFVGVVVYSAAVSLFGWFLFLVALGLPLSAFGR
ncbi:MAG: tripartite tricarboxylate transporter TctB family protein [Roseibium sp.]